jgi:transposase
MGRHELCRYRGYACLFDRSERALGTSGGRRSAHALRAARRFDVAVNTVKRAVVQARATGSLERKPIPGYPRRIGPEREAALRARLEAAPNATVLEHCAW